MLPTVVNDIEIKPTAEEEDLLDRSTKKPKPNVADCSEVIMDDHVDEASDGIILGDGVQEQHKPSYREESCPEGLLLINPADVSSGMEEQGGAVVAQGPAMVATDICNNEGGNHDPGLKGMMSENKGKVVDKELTEGESCFGPWMIARSSYRRKHAPSNVGKNNSNKIVNPHGSRFEILQQNDGDSTVNGGACDLEAPNLNSKQLLGPFGHNKPKGVKVNNSKPFVRQNKGQPTKSIAKPRIQQSSGNASSSPASSAKPATVDAMKKEIIKQKEEEILRVIRLKEKEVKRAFMEAKQSREFLDQFVQQHSDEVLSFVESSRAKGSSVVEPHSQPPDPGSSSGSKFDGGSVPPDVNAAGLVTNEVVFLVIRSNHHCSALVQEIRTLLVQHQKQITAEVNEAKEGMQ
ncbi:hypothetical protein RIF29_11025 [Crotalaria pallida]|uniref:Uncharacterized protein n=1 Tax=Crotalaria pallida TaxID=3830 RepID=A0AAN9IKX9_CROPI